MNTKKQKTSKGLTDKELVDKYGRGKIDTFKSNVRSMLKSPAQQQKKDKKK